MTSPRYLLNRSRPTYIFALASGVAALAYELSWAKNLSLTFGSSTLAASTVVAGFMGGMGVGAWLYHRIQARIDRPLLIYAVLELGIVVTTAIWTQGFRLLPHLFAAGWIPEGLGLTAFRVAFTLLLLLVPAALMGATYPALCTVAIQDRRQVDRHLGMIYGLNTVGAAAGALLAGVFGIQFLGIHGTVAAGNVVNLGVGVAALVLARGQPVAPLAAAEQDLVIPTDLPRSVTGTVIFLSGLATLSYEILWFRALRYVVGNSTFALTVVLFVFLLGLGVGAMSLRRVVARGRAELDLVLTQFGIAGLATLGIGTLAALLSQPELAKPVSVWSPTVQAMHWSLRLAFHGALAVILMLPATLLMGLSFPLATRLFLGDVRRLGARTGGAYLLSNLGSIAGSVGSALVVLPVLGTVGGTRAAIAVNLALGVLILAFLPLPARRLMQSIAAVSLIAALGAVFPSEIVMLHGRLDLLFQKEADAGTVQVLSIPKRPKLRGIAIDGTIIGVSSGFNPRAYSKQILLAHLPMHIDRRLDSTLTIGLGSAATLDALTSYPAISAVGVVEINEAVVEGSRFFDESRALDDPRTRLAVEDALHFLLKRRDPYDLIVSDGKQNNDFSGNSRLLSREFYMLARDRLSPHGIFVQWIPLGTSGFPVVVRTLAAAFPEVEFFFDPPSNILVVAAKQPLGGRPRLSLAESSRLRAAEDLRRFEIPFPEQLLWLWIASREAMVEVAGPGQLNTWNHPILEFRPYRASRAETKQAISDNLRVLLDAASRGENPPDPDFVPADGRSQRALRLAREGLLRLFEGDANGAQALAAEAANLAPGLWAVHELNGGGRGGHHQKWGDPARELLQHLRHGAGGGGH